MEFTEVITDALTGEVTVREFTKTEIAKLEKIRAEQNAELLVQQAEAEAKAAARAAILDRLGLTAEEAAILLS